MDFFFNEFNFTVFQWAKYRVKWNSFLDFLDIYQIYTIYLLNPACNQFFFKLFPKVNIYFWNKLIRPKPISSISYRECWDWSFFTLFQSSERRKACYRWLSHHVLQEVSAIRPPRSLHFIHLSGREVSKLRQHARPLTKHSDNFIIQRDRPFNNMHTR